MEISQELSDTENLLRDFISTRLTTVFGPEWIKQSGVTEDCIQQWTERMQTEKERLASGKLDERLLYFADFYNLHTLLKKLDTLC